MAWQDKVKEEIGKLCNQAWREANPKSDGHGKQKQYVIPEMAEAMLNALNKDDEEEGKRLLLLNRIGAESLI